MQPKFSKGGYKPMNMNLPSTGINDTDNYEEQPQDNQEEFPQKIKRNVIRAGVKAGETVLGGLGSLGSAITSGYKMLPKSMTKNLSIPEKFPLPTISDVAGYIEPKLEKYLGKGYLKPKGNIEEGIDMVAQDLPLIAFSAPVTWGTKLASSVASSSAMKATEALGGGTALQLLAGFAAGRTPRYMNKGLGSKSLIQFAGHQAEKDYKSAENWLKANNNPTFTSPKLEEAKRGILEAWDKAYPITKKKTVQTLNHLFKKIQNGTMTISDAKESKEYFNSLARTSYKDIGAKRLFRQSANALKDFLADASKEHPGFGIPYQRAEDLYTGVKAAQKIGDILKSDAGIDTFRRATNVTKALLHRNLGTAAKELVMETTKGSRKIARELVSKSKTVAKLVSDIKENAFYGDKLGVLNLVNKLDKKVQEEIQDLPMPEFTKGGYK